MGTLYLVATPIGNLEDITLRALRVLREVALIAAEDTRHTRKLLSHYTISTPLLSYHQHSDAVRIDRLLQGLAEGDVAVVTDAGTPGISDPGSTLVAAALSAGYAVVPVPGPVALIAALIASGLPTDHFTFLGFLPRKASERNTLLNSVRAIPHTIILYEAPHRLRECLDALHAALGDRQAAVARELTKLHEEWQRGTLDELQAHFSQVAPRGECVVLVAGASATDAEAPATDAERGATAEETAHTRLQDLLGGGMRTREAAGVVARETGLPRRVVYQMALALGVRE